MCFHLMAASVTPQLYVYLKSNNDDIDFLFDFKNLHK
jgi:hypothetical protein